MLADLAVHPATAAKIATQLGRHFAGDTPLALVARLQAAFLTSGGDLSGGMRPTMPRDAFIGGAVSSHLGVDPARPMAALFPASAVTAAVEGLVRI